MADVADDGGADVAAGLDSFGIAQHDAAALLDLAETAIRERLTGPSTSELDIDGLAPTLHQATGAFVTLRANGELNGCIGNIDGSGSLATNVADLAIKAAFDDPRLPALRPSDLPGLSIEISLLTSPVEVPASTRQELLRSVRRHEHGLIIQSGRNRGLFLPAVWEQLLEPDDFVDHLLLKAGIARRSWPDNLVAAVFTTATMRRILS